MTVDRKTAVMSAVNELPPVRVALARVAAEVGPIAKNARNTSQGFNFRGIDDVLNAVGPVLHRHHITITPEVLAAQWDSVEVGVKRTMMRSCTLTVRYTFHGPAGDCLHATVVAEALDSGDKAASKAMSVAMRTAILQTLSLPTGDRDPDHDSYERAAPERTPTSRSNGKTPIAAVLAEARKAGVEGEALAADVLARHGKPLGELTTSELRSEWAHWRGIAAQADPWPPVAAAASEARP